MQAVIIYVPIPQQKVFQKIQIILVRELEKKFLDVDKVLTTATYGFVD